MTQQRALATRRAVVLGAARVFERRGFNAATIAEIVQEANVTKGALYFHFDTKEALARAISQEHAVWVTIDTTSTESPLQQLVDINHRFVRGLQDDPLLRASLRLALECNTFGAPDPRPYREWIAALTSIMERAAQRGELIDGIDPGDLAHVLTSTVAGTQIVSEATTGREDLLERVNFALATIFRGVARPEALAKVDFGASTPAP